MRYWIQDPTGKEYEVTRFVLRDLDEVKECAFDLENVAVPSDFNMELNNAGGDFDSGYGGLFREEIGERTKFLVIVSGADRANVIFIGTVIDTKYVEIATVTVETRSVIASLLGCSFDMTTVGTWGPVVTATPARLVADLLGPNGLNLPGIFIAGPEYNQNEQSELNIGLEMRLSIPAGSRVIFQDFLQELNRVTGAYVYSYNGFMRYARQGGFDRLGFDYSFSSEVLPGTVKYGRPVLWQKTKVAALYWDGAANQKITRTMSDYFDTNGDTIMERFREKVIESDGLGGFLVHATEASANVGLQDVLAWRGFPRWEFNFDVDAIGEDVRNRAQGLPLLSRLRLIWPGGCVQLATIEKTTSNQKTTVKGLSLLPPTFIHPAKRLLPIISQAGYDITWTNNTPFAMVLYYRLESATDFTRVSMAIDDEVNLNNPDLEPVTWKVTWGLPCGEIPSPEMVFTPSPIEGFILGVSSLGDTL